jgi:hypothetical protein
VLPLSYIIPEIREVAAPVIISIRQITITSTYMQKNDRAKLRRLMLVLLSANTMSRINPTRGMEKRMVYPK